MAGSEGRVGNDMPKAMESEDGYSLNTTEEVGTVEAAETTSLLGGTQDSGTGTGNGNRHPNGAGDSWVGFEEFEGLSWWRTPSVFWLIPPYALFTLAFGGSIVPKINLIIDLVCKRYFAEKTSQNPDYVFTPIVLGGDNPQCAIPEVQRNVATFMLVLSVVVGVLSAYTVPKIGSLSDRYGRKRLLALTSFGGVLGELVTIITANYPNVIHYQWLVVGVIFDGLAGSFTAGSVLSNSYTSDCTPPSKRAVAIGYLHSCLFSGLAFGPLLAGYFVKWTGSLLSIFYVSVSCHVVFILFILFVLPESMSKRRQVLAREKHQLAEDEREKKLKDLVSAYQASGNRSNNFFWSLLSGARAAKFLASVRSTNPFEPLEALQPKGPSNTRVRRNLVLLASVDMIIVGAAMSSGQVVLLYSEYMFHWGNFETSRFISMISMVRVFALMGIFPIINYIFRIRPATRRRRESGAIVEKNAGADELDVWILRIAILSDVLGMIGYAVARTQGLFIVSGIVTALGGLGSATIQSALSKHVSAERVGELLGAIGLLHALSRILAPALFNGLYAATVKSFPQAVFLLITALFSLILVVSFFIKPHVYVKDDHEEPNGPTRPSIRRVDTLTDDEVVPRI